MLRPTVLIFSHARDEHLGPVLRRLSEFARPLVVDLRHFGRGLIGTMRPLSGQCSLRLPSGEAVDLSAVHAVWWRRPTFIDVPCECEPRYRAFVEAEQRQFVDGLLSLIPANARFYNHPDAHIRSDRKAYQLKLAASVGLAVPDTCMTSDPVAAANFLVCHPEAIYKSFWGSEEFWQPTRRVDEQIRANLNLLAASPVIFQEYIDGESDIRVTIIDRAITAVAFDISQSRYKYDVRIDTKNKAVQTELPSLIKSALFRFCLEAGLRYAAIDLRRRTDGSYVFFEVNPAGQFIYLDIVAGTNLAEQFAAALSLASSEVEALSDELIQDGPSVPPTASHPLNAIGTEVRHIA